MTDPIYIWSAPITFVLTTLNKLTNKRYIERTFKRRFWFQFNLSLLRYQYESEHEYLQRLNVLKNVCRLNLQYETALREFRKITWNLEF